VVWRRFKTDAAFFASCATSSITRREISTGSSVFFEESSAGVVRFSGGNIVLA
jgi:hypothetical protein